MLSRKVNRKHLDYSNHFRRTCCTMRCTRAAPRWKLIEYILVGVWLAYWRRGRFSSKHFAFSVIYIWGLRLAESILCCARCPSPSLSPKRKHRMQCVVHTFYHFTPSGCSSAAADNAERTRIPRVHSDKVGGFCQ